MTTAPVKAAITPEDLLSLPDSVNYELVDGNLVERNMGTESSVIAAAILIILGQFVRSRGLGIVAGADCGYRCFSDDPEKVRKPDVSFIRSGRLTNDRPPEGYVRIAPDLAVEVLSPGDLAYEIDQKIAEYLGAGVKLIWIINPKTRTVRIHRPQGDALGPIGTLSENDMIRGEGVVEGFECPVAEFFRV